MSEAQVKAHYLQHFNAYTNKINPALEKLRSDSKLKHLAKLGIDVLLTRLLEIPEHALRQTIRNQGALCAVVVPALVSLLTFDVCSVFARRRLREPRPFLCGRRNASLCRSGAAACSRSCLRGHTFRTWPRRTRRRRRRRARRCTAAWCRPTAPSTSSSSSSRSRPTCVLRTLR